MHHGTVKRKVVLSASELTFILIKANSCQTNYRISPISQHCGSDHSLCGVNISFMSSPDVVNPGFIVFADELIIIVR